MYLCPHELKAELTRCHETGVLSDALGVMLLRIADGVTARFSNIDDTEEVTSCIVCALVSTWHKPSPERSGRDLFNYYSTVAHNAAKHLYHRECSLMRFKQAEQQRLIMQASAIRQGRFADMPTADYAVD